MSAELASTEVQPAAISLGRLILCPLVALIKIAFSIAAATIAVLVGALVVSYVADLATGAGRYFPAVLSWPVWSLWKSRVFWEVIGICVASYAMGCALFYLLHLGMRGSARKSAAVAWLLALWLAYGLSLAVTRMTTLAAWSGVNGIIAGSLGFLVLLISVFLLVSMAQPE